MGKIIFSENASDIFIWVEGLGVMLVLCPDVTTFFLLNNYLDLVTFACTPEAQACFTNPNGTFVHTNIPYFSKYVVNADIGIICFPESTKFMIESGNFPFPAPGECTESIYLPNFVLIKEGPFRISGLPN